MAITPLAAVVLNSFQFDDYNAEKNTVRLYCVMDKGVDATWNDTHLQHLLSHR